MARKMRKFSDGGALGKYNRRMADIEKDFKKDSAGKSGRALEVLEAKRAQRTADAEDDRAKRTGADRTATRAAERAAESNLTKTRKFGAPKSVSTEAPAAKVTDSLGAITAPKSGIPTATKKAPVKTTTAPVRTPKADTPKADAPKPDYRKINFGKPETTETAPQAAARVKQTRVESGPSTKRGLNPNSIVGMIASGKLFETSDAFRKSQEAKYGKAKGGKVKKEKTMEYAKGGKMASCGMKKGGKAKAKPFAATKFGAAMKKKKSADTKGRAMMKFAKGGSIDGCAVKGKTKASMVKMARGGAAQMRGRDHFGGASFKKGGKSC